MRKLTKTSIWTPTKKVGSASVETLHRERTPAWATDRWALLERTLVLGSVSGVYQEQGRDVSREDMVVLTGMVDEDHGGAVETVVNLAKSGLAFDPVTAVTVLALAFSNGDDSDRNRVRRALPLVVRTAPELMAFAAACGCSRGWGRALRRAIGDWYLTKDVDDLAYQVAKYQSCHGYSHADLLRLAHPAPKTTEHSAVFKWVVDGADYGSHPLLSAVGILRRGAPLPEACRLIEDCKVPLGALPEAYLEEPAVWASLLGHLPLSAILAHLGDLGTKGLLVPGSPSFGQVVRAVTCRHRIRAGRIHPMQVAQARRGFGRSNAGSSAPELANALESAYRMSLEMLGPVGKRMVVSVGFGNGPHGLGAEQQMERAVACVSMWLESEPGITVLLPDGSALGRGDSVTGPVAARRFVGAAIDPVEWALSRRATVDLFVVVAEGARLLGSLCRSDRLAEYRRSTGPGSRLARVGFQPGDWTSYRSEDAGTASFVGFSDRLPEVVRSFALVGD